MRINRNVSRQREYQIRHLAIGLCSLCPRPVWANRRCFRCTVVQYLGKSGLLAKAKRKKAPFERFVAGLFARYTRVLVDEGFAVEVVREPEALIRAADFGDWVGTKEKRKLVDIVNRFDDRAIRKRFTGVKNKS